MTLYSHLHTEMWKQELDKSTYSGQHKTFNNENQNNFNNNQIEIITKLQILF